VCAEEIPELTERELSKKYALWSDNLGVLFGSRSGGLVDVDIDDDVALRFANDILPPTDLIFGRASRPGSHRLYRVEGIFSQRFEYRPARTKRGYRLVAEIRGDHPDGGSAMTVIPPSQHRSGENVIWERLGEPAVLTPEVLTAALNRLMLETRLCLGEMETDFELD
jgi:hypothetical protein